MKRAPDHAQEERGGKRAHPILELGERIAPPADLLTEVGEQEDRKERKRLEVEGEGAPGRRGDAEPAKVGKRQRQQRDRVPAPSDPHARQAPTPCPSLIRGAGDTQHEPRHHGRDEADGDGDQRAGGAGFEDSAAAAIVSSQPIPSVAAKNVGNGCCSTCDRTVLIDGSLRLERDRDLTRRRHHSRGEPAAASRDTRRGAPATAGRVCTDLRDKPVPPRRCSVVALDAAAPTDARRARDRRRHTADPRLPPRPADPAGLWRVHDDGANGQPQSSLVWTDHHGMCAQEIHARTITLDAIHKEIGVVARCRYAIITTWSSSRASLSRPRSHGWRRRLVRSRDSCGSGSGSRSPSHRSSSRGS